MSERDIVGFDILKNGAFEASMPEMDPNPIKTASWNKGFVEAASAGATWQQAEEAGWNTWREAMDPKAAQQYNGFLVKTGNRKGPMTVFWRVCDKRVPRPMSMICAIRKSGLTIWPANKAPEQCQPEELRFIDWNIAALKLRNNELDLRDGRKEKLLARLKELGYGQQVWKLLE